LSWFCFQEVLGPMSSWVLLSPGKKESSSTVKKGMCLCLVKRQMRFTILKESIKLFAPFQILAVI
jgi:hypothetical protein